MLLCVSQILAVASRTNYRDVIINSVGIYLPTGYSFLESFTHYTVFKEVSSAPDAMHNFQQVDSCVDVEQSRTRMWLNLLILSYLS